MVELYTKPCTILSDASQLDVRVERQVFEKSIIGFPPSRVQPEIPCIIITLHTCIILVPACIIYRPVCEKADDIAQKPLCL